MVINELGSNICTVDGPQVVFAGAPMHTRMTIVRLSNGDLWVHSPVELSDDVRSFIENLGGSVCALIAPNKYHHLFIEEWARAWPQALLFAETHVQDKIPALSGAREITNRADDLYRDDIDQVVIRGNRLFQEAVFFHKPSRTLILTDLMINLKTDDIRGLARWFLKFEGVTYPQGGIPRLYRWFTRDKAAARQALHTILAWQPQQLTFCHGEPFGEDAGTILQREFDWLLN